jgi:ankyrin repeat protein
MEHLLPVLPFGLLPSSLKLRRTLQDKLRFSVVGLLLLGLSIFSLSGMEKEKAIQMYESSEIIDGKCPIEDENTYLIMKAFMDKKSISEITHLLNTLNININSQVKINTIYTYYGEIYTLLRFILEQCNPNIQADVELVKLILQKGASLKQQPSIGWHPYLFYAIDQARKNNNLSIVKLLIEHGADVHFHCDENKKGHISALHYALYYFYGDTKCIIDYLLENGADANARDKRGYTPLAILADRFTIVMEAFKSNAYNFTPNFELFELVAEKLLENGADIYAKQERYEYDKGFVKKSNYDLLKPIMPNLDDIIKKAEDKKRTKKLAIDLKNAAAANNKHANQSIIVSNRESKLHEAFLSIRCLGLCFELNPNYIHSQFKLFSKPLLHAPFVGNIYKQATLNFKKQTNQENERSIEITEID